MLQRWWKGLSVLSYWVSFCLSIYHRPGGQGQPWVLLWLMPVASVGVLLFYPLCSGTRVVWPPANAQGWTMSCAGVKCLLFLSEASGWILGRALCTGDGPGCHSLCLPRKMSTVCIFLFGFLSLGSVCSVRPLHFSFPRASLVCQQHCSAGYLLKVLLEIPKKNPISIGTSEIPCWDPSLVTSILLTFNPH